MTAATRRRTVAEMEKRLASARELVEQMAASSRADMERYGRGGPGYAFAHGAACGYEGALATLTACFDEPGRDWMYRGT